MSVLTMWRDNPVMVKEFRVRMRGARAYWIITGYLLFLSFILFMQYYTWWNRTQAEGHSLASGSKIGQEFLLWITVTQAFLVAFITPAITSGAITIEREQRTLEMLEMTRLSPGQVVFGKLSSAVGFVILLLISSVPLASICFFLGGVSPEQIGNAYVMLAAGAFVSGTVGLVWSAVSRATTTAVIMTYATIFVPPIILFFVAGFSLGNGQAMDSLMIFTNLVSVFGIPIPDITFSSPIGAYFQYWNSTRYFGLSVPVWLPGLLTFGLIGLVLSATCASRVAARPENRSGVLRWLIVALFLEQLFFYFGARFCAYHPSAPAGLAGVVGSYPVTSQLLYPILLLVIIAPIFSTGDLRPSEAKYFGQFMLRGWKKLGWGTARFASGWPFLCVLAMLIVGAFALSFVAVGHGSDVASARIGGHAVLTVPFSGIQTASPPRAGVGSMTIDTAAYGGIGAICVMLLSVVTGIYFAGMYLSLAVKNRWVAIMMMYVGLAVVFIGPLIGRSYPTETAGTVLTSLYYLNPLYPIIQMSDYNGLGWSGVPVVTGSTPGWQVTTAVYLGIALVSIILTRRFVTRTAAQPVLAYDDLGDRD